MPGSEPKFLLHGCETSRLLQDYYSFLPCSDSGSLCGLLTLLCQPTRGKARLTEGSSFRRKQH
ncbi:mCG1036366 [Mus musculus]|nr:mCG1036366 [Mus musculus]